MRPMKLTRQALLGAAAGSILTAVFFLLIEEGQALRASKHRPPVPGTEADGTAAPAFALRGGSAAAPGAAASPAVLAQATREAAAWGREELLRRYAEQQRELGRLRGRLKEIDEDRGGERAPGAPDPRGFLSPSKEELASLAKDCKLKWDEPPLGLTPQQMGPESAEKSGLSEAERAGVNRAAAEFNNRMLGELRKLYVEVTGDAAGADSLTPRALEEEIEAKSPQREVQLAFQRISRERAGLSPPPADSQGLSAVERLMRLKTAMGDAYERELGAAVGPDVARALRHEHGGWGSKSVSSHGCPDSAK